MEWISVKDDLPRIGEWCLVVWTGVTQLQTWKFKGGNFYTNDDGIVLTISIKDKHLSHWMPLPEPPKDQNEPTI